MKGIWRLSIMVQTSQVRRLQGLSYAMTRQTNVVRPLLSFNHSDVGRRANPLQDWARSGCRSRLPGASGTGKVLPNDLEGELCHAMLAKSQNFLPKKTVI